MTNLSIIEACTLNCRYCFARQTLRSENGRQRHVTRTEFRRMLDFLERSGMDQVRLLGGEPTLHPEFCALVDEALARGFRVIIFSNGLMPEPALDKLAQCDTAHVAVMINTLRPDHPQATTQTNTLRRLGSRVTLALNIDTPGVETDFLFERIEAYGLWPAIRLGLAHPAVGSANRSLHPRYYAEVGHRLLDFAQRALERDIQLQFDCGFVPCMFPEGSLALLGTDAKAIGTHCSPIPDILPNGRMVPCYPLAAIAQLRFFNYRNADAHSVRAHFSKSLTPYRMMGLYKACVDCQQRIAGTCTGGCIAAAMRRLNGGAKVRQRG
jgi:radical SAM protein with 4Fe4S-binding SPASM domain